MFRETPVSAGHTLGHVRKIFELVITREFREENATPPRSQFPKRMTPKAPHAHWRLIKCQIYEIQQRRLGNLTCDPNSDGQGHFLQLQAP
tara:strand:+ start:5688 stop:5957 length:270 start_codon:yes stop_codon:yes gene_type:complete